jgi:hypothetical protein
MTLVAHRCPRCDATIRAHPRATVAHPCPNAPLRCGRHQTVTFEVDATSPPRIS